VERKLWYRVCSQIPLVDMWIYARSIVQKERCDIVQKDREYAFNGKAPEVPRSRREQLMIQASKLLHSSQLVPRACGEADQSKCSLLMLPGEIRNTIYKLSLQIAYDSIVIRVWNGHLAGWFTTADVNTWEPEYHSADQCPDTCDALQRSSQQLGPGRTSLLNVLLTCRQM
jgi:hypothetical protein